MLGRPRDVHSHIFGSSPGSQFQFQIKVKDLVLVPDIGYVDLEASSSVELLICPWIIGDASIVQANEMRTYPEHAANFHPIGW